MMNHLGARRGRMQTPGPPIIKAVSRESDDETPEPSPVGPPQPQAQPQASNLNNDSHVAAAGLVPPWTPQVDGTNQQQELYHKYPAMDDESLPSIPDAPSPYSPPPSSLFSGEEFAPKTERKPVPEQVRFPNGGGAPLNDLSLNQHPQQQQQQQNNQSSYGTPKDLNRSSQLLPTVLYLKKDLQESHQSLFLLQQENKALAAECDRFQKEMAKWQQAAETAASEKEQSLQQQIAELQQQNADLVNENKQALQQETSKWQQQMEAQRQQDQDKMAQEKSQWKQQLLQAKQEAEKLSNELLASQATVTRLETAQSQARADHEALQGELREARARLKEHTQSAAQKYKAAQEEHAQTVGRLEKEQKSAQLEMDRLRAMLHEANQTIAKGAAEHDATAQADILHFQTVADEAQAETEELRQQLAAAESEFTQQECTLRDEVDRLQTELAKSGVQDAQWQKQQAKSENCVKGIQEALADATERENELLSEKERAEQVTKELQQQVDRLQQLLAKSDVEKESLQDACVKKNDALKESYSKYKTLRAEKDKLQKEVRRQQKSSPAASGTTAKSPESESKKKLMDDIDRLHVALSKANAKCNELRTERSSLAKELAHLKHAIRNDEQQSTTNQHQPSILMGSDDATAVAKGGEDNLIPDRLGRIRDAAERAVLVKEYRGELSRLKAEHEAEIKRLTARHDQDLKDVFEEAKSDVSARARENRRRMQSEFDGKVAALERRYQAELARVQRECDKSTAVAEEAMEAAASEVATVTEQLDKETAARESLEGTVRDLERKLVIESQKSKLSVEWMKSRKQWQKETNNLLASIQEECNAVFAQNMVAVPATPRRASAEPGSSTKQPNEEQQQHSPSSLSSLGASNNNASSVLDTSTISNIENADPTAPVPTPWNDRKRGATVFRTSYNSPLDVTQAVDETEALVRSLLGN